jgi:hypothetical protein
VTGSRAWPSPAKRRRAFADLDLSGGVPPARHNAEELTKAEMTHELQAVADVLSAVMLKAAREEGS